MTAATVDQLVNDYLSRLEAAAAGLPDGRRAELLAEIREHIEVARSEGVAADEATTRTMLDQLGEPEEIAAAARAELDEPPAAPTVETRPGTGLELAAVLLLTIGSFIPFIGWAAGVVLLWTSRRWTIREKLLGTLIVPTGPGGVLFFGSMSFWVTSGAGEDCVGWSDSSGNSGSTCEDASGGAAGLPGWTGGLLFVVLLIAPFIVAGLLYSRARARADAEPPIQRPAAGTLTAQRSWTGVEITAVVLLGAGSLVSLVLFGPIGPAVALLAGLPFVWASSRWTRREKWTGTIIAAAPTLVAIVLVVTLGRL